LSHVLLGGDERQMTAVRFRLVQWGVTVGQLAFADKSPTVQDCDAVILLGKADEYRDACQGTLPDGPGGAAGPAAPLIFINSACLSVGTLPADWLVLAQLDDDGGNLRAALLSSFALARTRRGLPAAEKSASGQEEQEEHDTYLHFLGHELRSPLTAIKTSLEVLEGELGGLDNGQTDADSGLKMLSIALRNVRRLHRTVEWSQDLLAAAKTAGTYTPCQVAMQEMATRLQPLGEVRLDEAVREVDLQTDPELLTSVVTQMARAVGMAAPDSPLTIRVGLAPGEASQCHLIVGAADGEQVTSLSARERFGLVGPTMADGPANELERLARFMVAPGLVEVLGASLMASPAETRCPALVLSLDLIPQALPA